MYGFCNAIAGVESFLLNINAGLSKNCTFSVLVRNGNSNVKKIFEDNGIKVYDLKIPRLSASNFGEYLTKLDVFFKNHKEFSFLHMHGVDDPFVALIAKKNGIHQIACHVHAIGRENQSFYNNIVKNIFAWTNVRTATYLLACSENAGRSFYHKKYFDVIKNGIDTEHFKFNATNRKIKRDELALSDYEIAFCFVGRLTRVKNIHYLIDVFTKLSGQKKNAKLFIIGDGEELITLQNRCKENEMDDKVVFLGSRVDVAELLSAMDIYIQTSVKEGFSLSALEAQNSGLPTFISTGFPPEIEVTNLVKRLDLESGIGYWSQFLIDKSSDLEIIKRAQYSDIVKKQGYDIKDIANMLEERYYVS
jgi:glycosyltransferase involved in cell wall biosynthesis